MSKHLFFILIIIFFYSCSVGTDSESYLGFEVVEDFDNPVLNIISPSIGDTLKGFANIEFEVQDFSGIRDIQLWINQNQQMSIPTNFLLNTNILEWDTRELSGNFDIKLVATDSFGNIGESDSTRVFLKNLQIIDYYNTSNTSFNSDNIEGIEFDSEGNAYVSTGSQIFKKTGNSWSPLTFNEIVINPHSIYDFYIDRFDSLWVSARMNIANSNRPIYFSSKNGNTRKGSQEDFFYDEVLDIFRDSDDIVWLATSDGMYSINNGEVRKSDEIRTAVIFEIGVNELGYPIISDLRNTFNYNGSNWVRVEDITHCSSFSRDSSNAIWCINGRFGFSSSYQLFKIEGNCAELVKQGLPDNVLTFDSNNNLWFGGRNSIQLFEKGRFISYDTTFDIGSFFTHNWVNQIKIASDGKIWIATGHGLIIAEY